MTGVTGDAKPTKFAVAIVLRDKDGKFLAVRRSDDDDSLPGVWGLPAASRRRNESDQDAVLRAGREKLGVTLEALERIGTDRIDRDTFVLELSDYAVSLVAGEPSVPQPDRSVSQYTALQYTSDLGLLVEAARKGSLCSRVFLDSEKFEWR